NVPSGICFYTPDETQRHYLNELELYRGMTPQDPPKGELPITGFPFKLTFRYRESATNIKI
ncbi:hypothetical protein MJL27_26220, partial [Salmonella enterica subsp. enterica serovar Anatum]|nr:hypothetical protein [Salmonella enterica subsp. enterica serovar Anatum]